MHNMRALFLVALAGCASPLETGETSSAIINGDAADDAAVVAIVRPGSLCSGILVAPTVVLTAAHCVAPNATGEASAVFGPSAVGGHPIAVVDELADPAWTAKAAENDIGLLRLAYPADAEPAPMTSKMHGHAGDLALAMGYGIDGHNGGTMRRQGELEVKSIAANVITLQPDGDTFTCNGDSGGPVFIDGELVGINTRSDCQSNATAERIDVHLNDLIQPFIEDEHAGGCSAASPSAGLWFLFALPFCLLKWGRKYE